MPRSNGIFSLIASYFATSGTKIRADQHNPVLEDIANALTDSLPRDGSAPMNGNLPMAGRRITNLADGTNPTDAATVQQANVPAASTTVVGRTRYATIAESQAGTVTQAAVTPAGLGAAISPLAVVPTGAVSHFYLTAAPSGWVALSGQTLNRADYPALWAACGAMSGFGAGNGTTTFTVPDLNGAGRFIRGKQSSRAVGSVQSDALQGHNHASSTPVAAQNGAGLNAAGSQGIWRSLQDIMTGLVTDGTNGTPRVASETRPVNVALLCCIKA